MPAGLFVPTGLVFAQAPDCAALAVAAATALEPEVRSFSLQGLGDCPADPKIARLLESAIRTEDRAGRDQAFRSLHQHLDGQAIDFLINLYYEENLSAVELQLLYRYLAQALGPEQTGALPLLRRGLAHASAAIRQNSVIALGRLSDGRAATELMAELRSGGPRLRAGALRSLARQLNDGAVPVAIQMLSDEAPLQAAAIEYLAAIGSPRAIEALLRLRLAGVKPENARSVDQAVLFWARHEGALLRPLLALRPAVLHERPTTRSRIVASLPARAVLYAQQSTPNRYRQRQENGETVSGVWLRVENSDGLSGWIHEAALVPAIDR
ncbi:MAG: HEAT repeat domain-containing protein [Spirochaetales bacterium]|nr:HEAT repeat domain-containing protein [Spirochaetales bacterium]